MRDHALCGCAVTAAAICVLCDPHTRTAITSPYRLMVPVDEFVWELVSLLVYLTFSASDIQCGSFRYLSKSITSVSGITAVGIVLLCP